MSAPDAVVSIRALPEDHHPHASDADIVEIPMTAHDRRRVRRVIEAADGTKLAFELPTGTVLHPGQVVHRSGVREYVVTAAPEDVLVTRPRSVEEAARIGHLIGNLHRDIEVHGGDVIALADDALADRLTRAGVPFERSRRAFQGRAPGEHAH
ncbi:MAG: urease accessory protein UreE [Acidobacteria bacterium]|nr:MAG: urease accessory protein UreE [Acidobacteriota bacterium]